MNPPKRGKKYKEIVDRGCGGYQTWEGDYDCRHPYDWACDDCPCCIEYQKELWKKEGKMPKVGKGKGRKPQKGSQSGGSTKHGKGGK
jgi:hypothetical protein